VSDGDLLTGLHEAAKEAGIDLLGVTSAEPFDLREDWQHDQPKELLASAQSVAVAGFCVFYEPRTVPSRPGVPRGRFTPFGSRVFEQMERHCFDTVESYLVGRGYEAVAAPNLAIKPAIVRSGLGRYGRHAVVITPELGSMVMFAAVVTNAPLAAAATDRPVYAEVCASGCRLCVDACPTGALAGDYKLDRSRCVTNWLWGTPAPAGLRAEQQDRLFGCAECVRACPYSAPVQPRRSYPVPTDTVNDSPELLRLGAGDRDYYDRAIPTFPKRAGFEAMRGSAIVALGNAGDPAAEEVLAATLRLDDPKLRAYSAWALGRIRSVGSRDLLLAARESERDEAVAGEIEAALAGLRAG
jgi:epoxyqueuosine reductase